MDATLKVRLPSMGARRGVYVELTGVDGKRRRYRVAEVEQAPAQRDRTGTWYATEVVTLEAVS